MDLNELRDQLETDLEKSVISSMTLFNRFRFLDDRSKETGAFFDPRYIPFYYHLAKRISSKTLLHAGFGLGIESGVFLLGCKTIEKFLAFQDPMGQFYSSRVGVNNIKDKYKGQSFYYVGSIQDDKLSDKMTENEWDVVIVTERMGYDQHRLYLDLLWGCMKYDGLMVVDFASSHEPNQQAVKDFCKIMNRDPAIINTRYGVAIIKK